MNTKMIIYLLVGILVIAVVISMFISKNNKSSSSVPTTNGSGYLGKVGEVISYIDNPIISVGDITIKYIGTREQPATEQHVWLGGVDIFTVSTVNGKSFQINWSTGTGLLPIPSSLITKDGCYELSINIMERKKFFGGDKSIPGKLVLNKVSSAKCNNNWTKDLR
ncbi:MAG: hypothetical protein ABI430_01090 [Candidatus Taylorbacteria bacterium]